MVFAIGLARVYPYKRYCVERGFINKMSNRYVGKENGFGQLFHQELERKDLP
jgi:hypothetical protein